MPKLCKLDPPCDDSQVELDISNGKKLRLRFSAREWLVIIVGVDLTILALGYVGLV
jgi:hypothetical protein